MSTYIIGQGGPTDTKALALDTRKKRHVGNETRLEKPLAGMLEIAAIIEKTYPHTRLVSASAICNCFGLAFGSRRTWILDLIEVRKVLDDDGYKPVAWDPQSWGLGDIVLYRTQEDPLRHVAVIVQNDPLPGVGQFLTRVLSVWGESGEYVHPIEVGHPLLGKPFEVQSQRVNQ
jgi:hypothetical protein